MNFQNFKTNFNFITNIIILVMILFTTVSWAESNGIWVRAEDVVPGIFAQDEGKGSFTFPGNLTINQTVEVGDNICLGDECYGNWTDICNSWLNESDI